MSKHKEHQKRILSSIRKIPGVRKNASVLGAVKALVEKGEFHYAMELLLGIDHGSYAGDQTFYPLYSSLREDKHPELLVQIAEKHCWAKTRPDKGLSAEIYPNEWFVIPEPLAGEIQKI